MTRYAGETVVLGAFLNDDRNRPESPQPSSGVTFEALDAADAVVLAETAGALQNEDVGTSTGANTMSTLKDTGKNWVQDEWKDHLVRITSGTGSAPLQERRVKANTKDTLTLYALGNESDTPTPDKPWATTPDTTSKYAVHKSRYELSWNTPSAQKDKTLTVVTRAKDSYTAIEKSKVRLE